MSDHIENEGRKGYCMLAIFVFFLLFFITWISVYRANFNLTF